MKNSYCIIFVLKDIKIQLKDINEKIIKLFGIKNIPIIKNNFFINPENKMGYLNYAINKPDIELNIFLGFLKKNLADYHFIIRAIKIDNIETFLFDIK